MLTEDYILRMINIALAALLHLARLKGAEKYEEASQEAEQTLENMFGLRFDLLQLLDDHSFQTLALEKTEGEPQLLLLAAQLFEEHSELQSSQYSSSKAVLSRMHALSLYLEAVLSDAEHHLVQKVQQPVERLAKMLEDVPLSGDVGYALFCYYETSQAFVQAETAIKRLYNDPEFREAAEPELKDFYNRMLEKTDEELNRAGLPRRDIESKLAALQSS